MSGLDRTEILRRDCPTCKGNGYTGSGANEALCTTCEGTGLLEKEVPYKFDGPRSKEELAEIWEVPVEELPNIDKGHNAGDGAE